MEIDPTEAEIRRACRKIQERWSPEETRRRAAWCYQGQGVTVPTIDTTDIRESREYHE